jgi:hypothetical protein
MGTEITFKFGKGPSVRPLTAKLTPVTVFVGPNNSGKSRILDEIRRYCSWEERSPRGYLILDHLNFDPLTTDVVEETIRRFTLVPPPNQPLQTGEILYGTQHQQFRINESELLANLGNPTSHNFLNCYLAFSTLMLDGPNRVALIGPQGAGDLQGRPFTSLQVLFKDDGKRAEVRRILYEAFGSYFVIDPTALGQLRIKLSPTMPSTDMEEEYTTRPLSSTPPRCRSRRPATV